MADVIIAYAAGGIGRRMAAAALGDDVDAIRKQAQAVDRGNEVFGAWALSHGGSIVDTSGDQGRISLPAAYLDELPEQRRLYAERVGAPVSVGVGWKASESLKALMAAQLRGGEAVVFYGPGIDEELEEARREKPEVEERLERETLAPISKAEQPGRHLAGAPAKPASGPREHSEAEAARAEAEDAPPPETTHAAASFEDVMRELSQHADRGDADHAARGDEARAREEAAKKQAADALKKIQKAMPLFQQLRQANPEAYAAVDGVVRAMIELGRAAGYGPKSDTLGKGEPDVESIGQLEKGDVVPFPGNPKPAEDRGTDASVASIAPGLGRPVEGAAGAYDHTGRLPPQMRQNGHVLMLRTDPRGGRVVVLHQNGQLKAITRKHPEHDGTVTRGNVAPVIADLMADVYHDRFEKAEALEKTSWNVKARRRYQFEPGADRPTTWREKGYNGSGRDKPIPLSDAQVNARREAYARSIGLDPIGADREAKTASTGSFPNARGSNELPYDGQFDAAHETAHAMMTPDDQDLGEYQQWLTDRAPQPNDYDYLTDDEDEQARLDDDYRDALDRYDEGARHENVANTMETHIDRRAGVDPHMFQSKFRSQLKGSDPENLPYDEKSGSVRTVPKGVAPRHVIGPHVPLADRDLREEARSHVKGFDEGKRFAPNGRVLHPAGVDAAINERAKEPTGTAKLIKRARRGVIERQANEEHNAAAVGKSEASGEKVEEDPALPPGKRWRRFLAKRMEKALAVPTYPKPKKIVMPPGTQVDDREKVQHADGSTSWRQMRTGQILSQDPSGHPTSSRTPNAKSEVPLAKKDESYEGEEKRSGAPERRMSNNAKARWEGGPKYVSRATGRENSYGEREYETVLDARHSSADRRAPRRRERDVPSPSGVYSRKEDFAKKPASRFAQGYGAEGSTYERRAVPDRRVADVRQNGRIVRGDRQISSYGTGQEDTRRVAVPDRRRREPIEHAGERRKVALGPPSLFRGRDRRLGERRGIAATRAIHGYPGHEIEGKKQAAVSHVDDDYDYRKLYGHQPSYIAEYTIKPSEHTEHTEELQGQYSSLPGGPRPNDPAFMGRTIVNPKRFGPGERDPNSRYSNLEVEEGPKEPPAVEERPTAVSRALNRHAGKTESQAGLRASNRPMSKRRAYDYSHSLPPEIYGRGYRLHLYDPEEEGVPWIAEMLKDGKRAGVRHFDPDNPDRIARKYSFGRETWQSRQGKYKLKPEQNEGFRRYDPEEFPNMGKPKDDPARAADEAKLAALRGAADAAFREHAENKKKTVAEPIHTFNGRRTQTDVGGLGRELRAEAGRAAPNYGYGGTHDPGQKAAVPFLDTLPAPPEGSRTSLLEVDPEQTPTAKIKRRIKAAGSPVNLPNSALDKIKLTGHYEGASVGQSLRGVMAQRNRGATPDEIEREFNDGDLWDYSHLLPKGDKNKLYVWHEPNFRRRGGPSGTAVAFFVDPKGKATLAHPYYTPTGGKRPAEVKGEKHVEPRSRGDWQENPAYRKIVAKAIRHVGETHDAGTAPAPAQEPASRRFANLDVAPEAEAPEEVQPTEHEVSPSPEKVYDYSHRLPEDVRGQGVRLEAVHTPTTDRLGQPSEERRVFLIGKDGRIFGDAKMNDLETPAEDVFWNSSGYDPAWHEIAKKAYDNHRRMLQRQQVNEAELGEGRPRPLELSEGRLW